MKTSTNIDFIETRMKPLTGFEQEKSESIDHKSSTKYDSCAAEEILKEFKTHAYS